MESIWTILKALLSIDKCKIDNWVFKYVYWILSPIFLILSLVNIFKYYSDERILCEPYMGETVDILSKYCLSNDKALYIIMNFIVKSKLKFQFMLHFFNYLKVEIIFFKTYHGSVTNIL